MTRRSLLSAITLVFAVLALLSVLGAERAAALEVAVVSEEVVADFPSGITLELDYRSDASIEQAYLLYTLADQDVSTEIAADLSDDGTSSATAEIELAANFVPAGVDITYRWRLVGPDEAELTTPPVTLTWQDDRFHWERTASEDVEVFGYAGGAAARDEVLDSAQGTIDRMSEELDIALDHPLRIWVYASKEDFDGTLAANSQEWAAGAAYPELGLILAVIPEDRPSELGRIVPHEVSHQLLALATDNPYNGPATWLDEGLAVVNQTNGNDHMAGLVEEASRDGRLLPLTTLNNGFPFDSGDASLAYAQSFSVVTYLVETYGQAAITGITAAYRAGNTHDDVLRAAIGRDVDELDTEWRAWVEASAGGRIDLGEIARVLLYGLPAIGVVVFLVARRLHPPPAYADDDPDLLAYEHDEWKVDGPDGEEGRDGR